VTRSALRRTVAAACAALAVAAGTAPAAADGEGIRRLAERYQSLAAAMIINYARASGTDVGGLFSRDPDRFAGMLGVSDPAALGRLVGSAPDDVAGLAGVLAGAGMALDLSGVTSLVDVADRVSAAAGTLDARVVAAGAEWAGRLASLRVGDLPVPTLELQPGRRVPAEGLVFGLALDRSMAALAADHPDVLGTVLRDGTGSPERLAAWRESLERAAGSLRWDLSSLPSPGAARMMEAMASGRVPAGSDPGDPCVTGGLYAHSMLLRLFDPGENDLVPDRRDGNLSTPEWERTQDWIRRAMLAQNPRLAERVRLAASSGAAAGECATVAAARAPTVSSLLPGILEALDRAGG
jgi:hypothetical protein